MVRRRAARRGLLAGADPRRPRGQRHSRRLPGRVPRHHRYRLLQPRHASGQGAAAAAAPEVGPRAWRRLPGPRSRAGPGGFLFGTHSGGLLGCRVRAGAGHAGPGEARVHGRLRAWHVGPSPLLHGLRLGRGAGGVCACCRRGPGGRFGRCTPSPPGEGNVCLLSGDPLSAGLGRASPGCCHRSSDGHPEAVARAARTVLPSGREGPLRAHMGAPIAPACTTCKST
mmetsp:Transcript_29252/g.90034  ORF Transcript_29252/g.90034 Transcript_29252/m.90034 type:complete len:226 (-) Transcript_29252:77-754(-)